MSGPGRVKKARTKPEFFFIVLSPKLIFHFIISSTITFKDFKDFKLELLKQVESYCSKYSILENPELITATVLDPRYKRLLFLSTEKERNKWYKIAKNTIQG